MRSLGIEALALPHAASAFTDHDQGIELLSHFTMSAVNVSWVVPPLSQLNISDCAAVTAWYASFLTGSEPGSGWILCPYRTAVEFVASLVPDEWDQPTIGDAIVWYTAMYEDNYLNNDTTEALVDFSVFGCGTQICSHLDWDGDSDLTGIGVSCKPAPAPLRKIF